MIDVPCTFVSKPGSEGWKYVLLTIVDTCEENHLPAACMEQLSAVVCEKRGRPKPAS